MAFTQFINGSSPATGAAALWSVIQMWVAAGAAVLADSDGTTYNASGGQVVSGASGAGGLGNTNAWVRIQFPGGREMVWQRGTNNTAWRVKYSAAAGFSGGTPSASQTPAATDTATRAGGGTDASPTFATIFASDGTYKLYAGAGGAADGWWYACTLTATDAMSGGMFLDPLSASTTGDADAAVIGVAIVGAAFTKATLISNSATPTTSGVMGWLKYNLVGSGFVVIPVVTLADSGGDIYPNGAGTNPHTSKDALRFVEYVRRSSLAAPTGPKGVSSLVAWNASTRTTKETFTVSSTRDRIVFGDVSFPWNGAVVL